MNRPSKQKLEMLINEYERLHKYSTTTSSNLKKITLTVGLGITTAMIGAFSQVAFSASNKKTTFFIFCGLIPIIVFITIFAWLGEHIKMARVGNYLMQQENKINALFGSDVLGWEKFIRKRQNKAASYIDILVVFGLYLIAVGSTYYGCYIIDKGKAIELLLIIVFLLVGVMYLVMLLLTNKRFGKVDSCNATINKKIIKSMSIIIPSYNESKSLAHFVPEFINSAERYCNDVELIISDDGSVDDTKYLVNKLQRNYLNIKYINNAKNKGVGAAIRNGLSIAEKDYALILDADGQYSVDEIGKILDKINQADSFFPIRDHRYYSITRLIISYLLNFLARVIWKIEIRDIFCGFKLFKRDLINPARLSCNGSLINVEIYWQLRNNNSKMAQFYIHNNHRIYGSSKIVNVKTAIWFINDLRNITVNRKHLTTASTL